MRGRDVADYAALSVLWGVSFSVVLRVVDGFGWVGAVTLRALVAGGVLLALAAVTRRRLDFSVGWLPFAVVGATTVAAQLIGLSYAAPRIGTALVAIIVATIPLFSMVIGHLWGIEHLAASGRVGVLIGIVGIVLLVGFPGVPVTVEFVLGVALSIVGAVSAAFGSNYARRILTGVGSYEVTTGAFLFGGVLTLPLLLFVPVPGTPEPADYAYLLVLGGVMSALTYVLYFRLVADIGPTRAISVEFAVTAVAIVIGAVFLGERLTAVQWLGAVVVLAGCLLVLGLVPHRASSSRRRATGDPVRRSEPR